jgi:hypothetical protein
MSRRLASVRLALVASVLLVACSVDHNPVAPPAAVTPVATGAPASAGLLGGLLGGIVGGVVNTVTGLLNLLVGVVERVVPLSNDVSWSFYAGPGGARSSNTNVGLSVFVPPGALTKTVKITVTAKKGKLYDYHFEPEGLQFAVPVVLTQTLPSSAFSDGGTNLKGAYYSAPTLEYDAKTGQATVNEIQPTIVDAWRHQISFTVRHFSGYVVASCARGGE